MSPWRASNLAASLGPAWDGDWWLDDVDVAIFTLPILDNPQGQRRGHAGAHRRLRPAHQLPTSGGSPTVDVLFDEFGSLAGGWALAINIVERARSWGAGVLLSAQGDGDRAAPGPPRPGPGPRRRRRRRPSHRGGPGRGGSHPQDEHRREHPQPGPGAGRRHCPASPAGAANRNPAPSADRPGGRQSRCQVRRQRLKPGAGLRAACSRGLTRRRRPRSGATGPQGRAVKPASRPPTGEREAGARSDRPGSCRFLGRSRALAGFTEWPVAPQRRQRPRPGTGRSPRCVLIIPSLSGGEASPESDRGG
jgi:hypothetical protein